VVGELGAVAAALRAHELEAVQADALLARLARGGCDLALLQGAHTELVERVRAAHRALPLLVLAPGDDVAARVRALESGADDCLPAPFAASQLAARVGALGRRAALVPAEPEAVEADGCVIDLARASAARGTAAERLTAREVAILRWLLRHRGRPVSRAELLEHVWGVAPTVETRAVDVAILGLRRKIERDAAAPRLVVSVRGLGYAWGPDLTEP